MSVEEELRATVGAIERLRHDFEASAMPLRLELLSLDRGWSQVRVFYGDSWVEFPGPLEVDEEVGLVLLANAAMQSRYPDHGDIWLACSFEHEKQPFFEPTLRGGCAQWVCNENDSHLIRIGELR